jgi:very-short-patch-repair endonuclease
VQSPFEREVMKRLAAAGYQVTPNWKIGAFRIDLVVEGNGKRLAIECDGDRYQPLEKLHEDMDRQSVLERMGWIFTRVRSSEFLRNPDRTLKPVLEKLQQLEISPVAVKPEPARKGSRPPVPTSQAPASQPPPSPAPLSKAPPSQALIDRVVRRAEELLASWAAPQEPGGDRTERPRAARHAVRNQAVAN